jgi:hypothetical protein
MSTSARIIRRAITATAFSCVAVLPAACGASSGPSAAPTKTPALTAASAASAGADTFIAEGQNISGTPLHKPACPSGCVLSGDATSVLYDMTWTRWTGTEAAGTGTENIEDCVPNCANGGQHRVRVAVTFSRPVKDCPAQSAARWLWSRVSFGYPRGLPGALRGANAPKNPWTFSSLIAQAKQRCS